MKLLPSSKTCSCGRAMNLVKRKSSPEERAWRCPRKGCLKEVALRKGMFFEGMYESFLTRYVNLSTLRFNHNSGSHLEILQILRLLHQWSTKTPVGKAQDELKVSDSDI